MLVKKPILLMAIVVFATAFAASDNRVAKLIERGKSRYDAKPYEIRDVTILHESGFIDFEGSGALKVIAARQIMAKDNKVRRDTRVMLPETAKSISDDDIFRYAGQGPSSIFDGKELWYLEGTGYKRKSPVTGPKRLTEGQAPQEKTSARDQIEMMLEAVQTDSDGQVTKQVTGLWPTWLEPESKLLGVEEVKGRPCHIVEMPPATKTPFEKVWIDVETLRLARATISGTPLGPSSTLYEDWRGSGSGDLAAL